MDPVNDNPVGNLVIEALGNTALNVFNAFVAFLSIGGLKNILDQLTAFRAREGQVCLFIGVDLNGTSKEALEKLLELDIETYVVFSPNNIIYHPKIYIFKGQQYSQVLIGSSNLTERGLFQSIESSIAVKIGSDDAEGMAFLASIYSYYGKVMDRTHPNCKRLTADILALLVANRIVLPEAESRKKFNNINKEYAEKKSADYDALLKTFQKLTPKRPPKGFKNVVNKDEIIIEDDDSVKVVNEEIELKTGMMWVETGKMTGGSKNQLDVSKRGVLNGQDIDGSVSYFGIDPDDTGTTLDFSVHLANKIYKGNTVKYTPDNSNWRIQLKGRTDDGERLTRISRMELGHEGGFIDKILLFTRIDETNYKLEILDKQEMDRLIQYSSAWGKMGNATTGRAYGFI